MSRKPIFESKPLANGDIRISLFRPNGKQVSIEVPPEMAVIFAAQMIGDSKAASGDDNGKPGLEGTPVLVPSSLSLTSKDEAFGTAIILRFGKAKIGFAIPSTEELGKVLLAASANDQIMN